MYRGTYVQMYICVVSFILHLGVKTKEKINKFPVSLSLVRAVSRLLLLVDLRPTRNMFEKIFAPPCRSQSAYFFSIFVRGVFPKLCLGYANERTKRDPKTG